MKSLRNQRGALTLDFIFALIMVMGTTLVFGMFCFTLSLIEIIQYTAYSSSRGYFAGHVTRQEQQALADGVYNELVNGKFAFFLNAKKGWFTITPRFDDFRGEYSAANANDVFVGAQLKVQAKILGFSVPFIGSTARDQGYRTTVTSFIGREVTSEECLTMIAQRYNLIKTLDTSYATVPATSTAAYATFDDNGC